MNYNQCEQADLTIIGELRYCKKSLENIANLQEMVRNSLKKKIIVELKARYISPALYPLFMSLIESWHGLKMQLMRQSRGGHKLYAGYSGNAPRV